MASADRLRVFLSSVMGAEDLETERDIAAEAIRSLELTVPWLFERAPAEPTRSRHVYLREVADCDLLVTIVSRTHSSAVQEEWEKATEHSRPILAFVRRLEVGELPTEERSHAVAWLRERFKYRTFVGSDDLRDAVRDSVIAELVRGYRQYRLAHQDFKTLVESAPSTPSLLVRPAEAKELPAARNVLLELKSWYPEIGPWVTRVTGDIQTVAAGLRIAQVGNEIAGLSFSRDKEPGVRKFSTIYVRQGFRGESIGPRLVYEEVQRSANEGIRKAYVTVADELLDELAPMLQRYGFVIEGASAGRYRPRAAEWVMSKTFVFGPIGSIEFPEFVEKRLVSEQGGRVEGSTNNLLRVRLPRADMFGLPGVDLIRMAISTSPTPELEYRDWAEQLEGQRWVFVSLYGRPADASHWSSAVDNWIDGEDLQSRFYPVELVTPEQHSIICTIRPAYADALIPEARRPTLLSPERLQIRPDNAYYRTPDRHVTLRRGSRIFFYVSAQQELRGSGRIREARVDSPEELIAKYGSMGVLKFDDLREVASRHHGKVLAIAFDWYREHERKLNRGDVERIVQTFNPQSAKVVTYRQQVALTEASS